jgi:hypothetical protein
MGRSRSSRTALAALVGLLLALTTAAVVGAQEPGLQVVDELEPGERIETNKDTPPEPSDVPIAGQAIPGIPDVAPGASPGGFIPLALFGVTPTPIGDEEIINFTTPQFVYNGEAYNALGVDSNGYLVIGGGTSADNTFNPVGPSPALPNNILAPFWTDLDGTATPGIYIATLTDGVNTWIVVEWRVNVFFFGSPRTFQVWIGINGVQDISFTYDPLALPADPFWNLLVGAENRLGQGDLVDFLPTEDLRVNTPNEPPVVDAGAPQTTTGASVILSGTATDADGPPPLTTTWDQVSGPTAIITSPTSLSTQVDLIGGVGTYVFRLTGFDSLVFNSDVVVVTRNAPPPAPSPPADGVGVVDQGSGLWTLRRPDGSTFSFFYGNPGDVPIMGDWNCDGISTPGLYRQSDGFVYLRNSNTQGIADIRFFFGNPGDLPMAGDFNGDGCDTVSIYRASEARWYVINALGANDGGLGPADFSYLFGDQGDVPVVGDWNNDGIDTPGLRRFSNGFVYIRNSNTQGNADQSWFYGDNADHVFTGDFDGDGADSIGLFRPANTTIYLRNSLSTGIADTQFQLGTPNSKPVAGRLN